MSKGRDNRGRDDKKNKKVKKDKRAPAATAYDPNLVVRQAPAPPPEKA
ncbi:MAG TPA: hypothetical protein VNI34_09345 [Candidatus Nitrosotalea sp.]|nr:hypothetical protein [Candidatus Nitrosotalea sp.]